MSSFRYIVGIDLGTSSCALSFVDRYSENPKPQTLPITQWHEQGLIEANTLPSFCYIPKNSKEAERFKTPFSTFPEPYAVGLLAQERLATHSDLVVHSAKSWLCHGGVDRESKILPWHSDTRIGEKRLSPVFVSSLYLRHLKDVWNTRIADGREDFQLEKQKIIITVPASFDEVASSLTLEASRLAGLNDVTLCEEPQAAFYYWLNQKENIDRNQNILVVDIGGGTSDFCLFKSAEDSTMQRIAVSEHILLGGDNMDLALAHLAEKKLQEQGLQTLRGEKWAQLVFECKRLKETFLCQLHEDDAKSKTFRMSFAIASGSKLFGNTHTLEFHYDELVQTIAEGFFPFCSREDKPHHKDLGLKEWGLPYAQDTAVTRHLAQFLNGKTVDCVLYTGGTLIPNFLRERLTQILSQWQNFTPKVLENDAYELAVSRGASLFGYRQLSKDQQVLSHYPRSLYIKVQNADKTSFLCIVPKGFSGLESITVNPPGLHALTGQLARFELWSSLHRPQDIPGAYVDVDGANIKPVSVLQTRLGDVQTKTLKKIPIFLKIHLASTGLLELSCVPQEDASTSFPLKFQLSSKQDFVSSPTQSSKVDEKILKAIACIQRFYGKEKVPTKDNPMSLMTELEQILGSLRKDWDLSTLRSLWSPLREGVNRRNRSEQHELAWLSLAGFVLRPGYGEQNDAMLVREIQFLFNQGPAYPLNGKIKNQWWIFWRRLAGGLDRSTQDFIFSKVYSLIKKDDASPEMFLLLGSLERADMQKRISFGQWLSSEIISNAQYKDQKLWALTRIANRLPLYGGPECVVRPNFITPWLEKFLSLDFGKTKGLHTFFINACRLIQDRDLDVSEDVREKVLKKLEDGNFPVDTIKTYVPQDLETVSLLLGEAFPVGLILN